MSIISLPTISTHAYIKYFTNRLCITYQSSIICGCLIGNEKSIGKRIQLNSRLLFCALILKPYLLCLLFPLVIFTSISWLLGKPLLVTKLYLFLRFLDTCLWAIENLLMGRLSRFLFLKNNFAIFWIFWSKFI
jgi:hypothetical protein